MRLAAAVGCVSAIVLAALGGCGGIGGDSGEDTFDTDYAVSPDGKSVAFSRLTDAKGPKDEKAALFVMRLGGRPRQITSGDFDDLGPSWSPDGSKLVFTPESPDEGGQLYVVQANGTGLIRLAAIGGTHVYVSPGWSPDGSRIVLMRNLPGDRVGYDVVNADGTGLRRLGTGWSVGSSPPKWSPDGTAIVFALSDIFGTDDGVWLVPMKLIGHRKHLAEDASHPAWSPDGSRIAFSRRDGEVVVMDVRSRTGRTVARGNDVRAPLWSRDGRRIAFTAVPDEAPEQDESDPWGLVQLAYREVYVVNTDGTGLRRLTRDQHEDTLVDWLPGGRIAVLNEEAFYVIGAEGTGRRAWSRAGRAG